MGTTTRAAPTLVEEAGAQGKVETVGEQIVEAAAEAKADVVAVVEAVQEKIAEVVSEEKVAETVTEIKEAIADAVEKVEQRLDRSLRSRANLPWNAGRSLVVVEGFFHSKRATDICRSLHEYCRAEDSLCGSMWRTPRP